MTLPLCLLVSVGERRSQRPGPLLTLGLLGPSHQRHYKSRVSLRGPPCAHSVFGTPHEEVRNMLYGAQMTLCCGPVCKGFYMFC